LLHRRTFGARVGAVVDDAIVMLGVLKEGLGHNPVTGGKGLARQGEVFLIYLSGVATDLAFGAIALEGRVPILVTVGLIPVGAPPQAAPAIGVLSHNLLRNNWRIRNLADPAARCAAASPGALILAPA